MLLVDTSVWVEHLRGTRSRLSDALEAGTVLVHPFVIGEIACGTLRNRSAVLNLLTKLPLAPRATDDEALAVIELRSLSGRGIGWVDVHLLAAALILPGTRVWTLDRRLAEIAAELRVGYEPGP